MITLKSLVFFASLLVTFGFIEDSIENIIVFSKKSYDEIKSDKIIGKTTLLFRGIYGIVMCGLWTWFYILK